MADSPMTDAAIGWQVSQTVHQLFQHLDEGEFVEMAALFAPDGVWCRQGVDLVGPAAVLDAMRQRPAGLSTRHVVANMIVGGDAGIATARYYLTVYAHQGAPVAPLPLETPQFLFVCDDRLVGTPQGWRFARRAPRLIFARS